MAVDETQPERLGPHPSREPSPLPDSPDPIEIALRAVNAGAPPDGPAAMLLLKQGGLIDEQRHLTGVQRHLVNAQIAGERMGVALKVLTVAVGLIVALAFGSMIWTASQERGLVIEPFSVPPDFAQRGVTGQVIASRLLDRLSEMGEKTVSSRPASTYANNWNGDIKVQIPQTGVSVGELRRTLVEWLGRQTSIGGELYRTPTGLTLAARTGTAAAVAHAGASEAELDRMIQGAAESVYATTQPYRYAIYLRRNGDAKSLRKAMQVLEGLTRTADEVDRIWAYNGLSVALNDEGDFRGAIRAAEAALAIAPRFAIASGNRADYLRMLGLQEAALHASRDSDRSMRSDGSRYFSAYGLARNGPGGAAEVAAALGDFQSALLDNHKVMATSPGDFYGAVIRTRLGLHQPGEVREILAQVQQAPPEAAPRVKAMMAAELAILAASVAFEREDWPRVHRLASGIRTTHLPTGWQVAWGLQATPLAAIALARSGDSAGAQRLIATTPLGCYRCVVGRGVVAALAGDARASERWFADAVRQGPSLPFAHADWGRARLARGDIDGAIAMFGKAHAKGPRWADPLKYWGDALVRKGDAAQAMRKYQMAADRAPRWGALHLAWGRALGDAGRHPEARARYRAAAGMDLSASDRSEAQRLLKARS